MMILKVVFAAETVMLTNTTVNCVHHGLCINFKAVVFKKRSLLSDVKSCFEDTYDCKHTCHL